MKRVFIVGCPRSGTTLLQGLLAAHRGIYSFTESHFLDFGIKRVKQTPFYHVSRRAGDLVEKFLLENNCPGDLAEELGRKAPSIPLIPGTKVGAWVVYFKELWDSLAQAEGVHIWLEKTPDHLNRLKLIDKHIPDARVIHIIRQGADVVASLFKASRAWGRDYSIDRCIYYWELAMERTAQRVAATDDRIVVYEDLAHNPQIWCDPIFKELGLEPLEDLEKAYQSSIEKVIAPGESWKNKNPGKIRPSSTFEASFTASEREYIQNRLDHDRYQELRSLAFERLGIAG